MTEQQPIPNPSTGNPRAFLFEVLLVGLGVVSTIVYGRLVYLSGYFEVGSSKTDRPIVLVLGLFGCIFACYLFSIWFARYVRRRRAIVWIWVFAVLFRLVMLRSVPIQEVDIYRYLWDGIVSTQGISPYKYAPGEVLQWSQAGNQAMPATTSQELSQLAMLVEANPPIRQLLGRVHFRQIPTVYPPVSQWGFALVTKLTPSTASVTERLLWMRSWLVLCDLGTLAVLALLLQRLNWHPAGALIYGWCPLVIKEIANSGHLDSMAVLATMVGVYCAVRYWQEGRHASQQLWATMSGCCIAVGIGAKIYPVALVPWIVVLWWAKLRLRLLVPLTCLLVATTITIWPMTNRDRLRAGEALPQQKSGLEMFYRYWEMNDLLFLVAVENLKPIPADGEQPTPWFSVVPNGLREWLVNNGSAWSGWPEREVAFQATRFGTMALLGGMCCFWLWRVRKSDEIEEWLRVAFLSLAWFWMLCPTQNPWYWTWVMPLVPFARYRSWLLISGVAMVYYLRFWLEYQYPNTALLGTPYEGTLFFDFVVPWLEFGPVLLLLALEMFCLRRARYGSPIAMTASVRSN